jgi:hypothetical protein
LLWVQDRYDLQEAEVLASVGRSSTGATLVLGRGVNSVGTNQSIAFDNPDKAVEKLAVLIGSISAGNNSPELQNQLMETLDYLLRNGAMDKKQHATLYKRYIA